MAWHTPPACCLTVVRRSVPCCVQVFWGGGTVALATSSDHFHVLKCRPSDKLEDGTVSFLDIMALKHGEVPAGTCPAPACR